MKSMKFDLRFLDSAARDYLRFVRQNKIGAAWGIYHGGSARRELASLALGTALVVYCFQQFSEPWFFKLSPDLPWWPAVGFIAGALLLVDGTYRIIRKLDKSYLGEFDFIDPCYLWRVSMDRVEVIDLDKVQVVTGKHSRTQGFYTHTELLFDRKKVTISNKKVAENMHAFAQALLAIRAGRVQMQDLSSPMELGRAIRLMLGHPMLNEMSPTRIPIPEGARATPVSTRWVVALAVSGITSIYALYFVPSDAAPRKDDYLVAAIERAEGIDAKLEAIDHYLAALPAGAHLEKVLEMRDDHRFEKARDTAIHRSSPAALRDYLIDSANRRHRAEAQILIGKFYEQAISRLETLPRGKQAVDKQLLSALVGLIESIKSAPSPRVSVKFHSSVEPEPIKPEQKRKEELVHAAHLSQNRVIKAIAGKNPKGSAVIDLGDTFSATQIALREKIILERLNQALGKIINQDLLRFEIGDAKTGPRVEVSYRTEPSGSLYLYKENENERGLLRGYKMAWALTVDTGTGTPFSKNFNSEPLEQLRMQGYPGDPAWAAYSVMLYSAFHEFSSRLIRMASLEVPPSPDTFSFADATGTTR
jgi:hypothetical protein